MCCKFDLTNLSYLLHQLLLVRLKGQIWIGCRRRSLCHLLSVRGHISKTKQCWPKYIRMLVPLILMPHSNYLADATRRGGRPPPSQPAVG